jgi:hypothetical protein
MSNSVVFHPHRELMAEAQREREVISSPEGQALLDRVLETVRAYSEFLEQHGLIWESRLKASSLVITHDYGAGDVLDVCLKDGALDRVYGNGTNPDPLGGGPPDISHKQRMDD